MQIVSLGDSLYEIQETIFLVIRRQFAWNLKACFLGNDIFFLKIGLPWYIVYLFSLCGLFLYYYFQVGRLILYYFGPCHMKKVLTAYTDGEVLDLPSGTSIKPFLRVYRVLVYILTQEYCQKQNTRVQKIITGQRLWILLKNFLTLDRYNSFLYNTIPFESTAR